MMEEMKEVVELFLDEEDFDWDNCDELGNPKRVFHIIPRSLRRRWQFFLLQYWDPLMELKEHKVASPWKCIRCVLRLVPLGALLAAMGWYGYSYYINLQYDEGSCIVRGLPPKFHPAGNMEPMVRGEYTVSRTYRPTPDQPENAVIQVCDVTVPCDSMSYGETPSDEDDRCTAFRTWKWGDDLSCWHHKDDMFGAKNMTLYCLNLPSDLERETFSVVVSSVVLVLALAAWVLLEWRERGRVEHNTAVEEAKAAEERELAEAKQVIEDREAKEAARHANRSSGDGDEDEESHSGTELGSESVSGSDLD